jgi:transcriptional regulator with XRE-family HTH domain
MTRTYRRQSPAADRQTRALGERLRLARIRRSLSTVVFAERMGVTRTTLSRLEKGDPNIALGTYLRALRILGLERDLDLLAKDDELGRKLQDLELETRRPRQRTTSAPGSGDEHGSG